MSAYVTEKQGSWPFSFLLPKLGTQILHIKLQDKHRSADTFSSFYDNLFSELGLSDKENVKDMI